MVIQPFIYIPGALPQSAPSFVSGAVFYDPFRVLLRDENVA